MRSIYLAFAFAIMMVGCNNAQKKDTSTVEIEKVASVYQSFGDKIDDQAVLSKAEIQERYKNLKSGDTVALKFKSEVKEVCQSKGCWMRMDLDEDEVMVKFKDYGFFMPKNIAGEEVILEGIAFIEEVSVEEQRHYAEDAGKTKEEIEAITETERTLSFVANGVLIEE